VMVVMSADGGTAPGVKAITLGKAGASGENWRESTPNRPGGLPLLMNVLYRDSWHGLVEHSEAGAHHGSWA